MAPIQPTEENRFRQPIYEAVNKPVEGE